VHINGIAPICPILESYRTQALVPNHGFNKVSHKIPTRGKAGITIACILEVEPNTRCAVYCVLRSLAISYAAEGA
jgi:hypothetical protein